MSDGEKRTFTDKIVVDYDEMYLTEYSVYKTEEFSLATNKLVNVNLVLTHLAFSALKAGIREGRFLFRSGDVALAADFLPERKEGAAVIFYDFLSYPVVGEGDGRLRGRTEWHAERTQGGAYPANKLYRTFSSEVNLPLLNEEQRAIVYTDDRNMLVQGIAGSGKTNVCIDKILFAAASSYKGRTLYSTYSRGLLLDVKKKVDEYARTVTAFIESLDAGRVRLETTDLVAASRVLGVPLNRAETLRTQLAVGERNVYDMGWDRLVEDFYRERYGEGRRADEVTFDTFTRTIKNYNLAQRMKKHAIPREVLYKEIYGYIFGRAAGAVDKTGYVAAREGTFARAEAEYVYDLSTAYREYLGENGYYDPNLACEEMTRETKYPVYSLAILDEVQDFTRVQLEFFKSLAIKLFCVGDASQMVNPAYFSFAALKDLLYKKDVTEVSELKYNYRNSKEIADIVKALADLNRKTFGVHGFVLDAEAVSREKGAFAVSFPAADFIERMARERTDNFTIVVATQEEKERLRRALPLKEILTVSEIKGLERDTVVLYNVLSSNKESFARLSRTSVDRKTADENSLYRYYFNLFYVGVSRARRHLFVAEKETVPQFAAFFKEHFEHVDAASAVRRLKETVGSTLVDQAEYRRRVTEFVRLGQYDNAGVAARSLLDDRERDKAFAEIEIWRDYVSAGEYVNAGIAYWERGYNEEAKEYFTLAGEPDLTALVDATTSGEDDRLDYRILSHYDKLSGNAAAMKIMTSVLKKDVSRLRNQLKEVSATLKGQTKGAK